MGPLQLLAVVVAIAAWLALATRAAAAVSAAGPAARAAFLRAPAPVPTWAVCLVALAASLDGRASPAVRGAGVVVLAAVAGRALQVAALQVAALQKERAAPPR
jgi:hypothetical protein